MMSVGPLQFHSSGRTLFAFDFRRRRFLFFFIPILYISDDIKE